MKYSPIALFAAAVFVLDIPPALAQDDWVQKSNEHAQIVLEAMAKFSPESAGSIGVDGLDEEILDLRERLYERDIEDSEQVLGELRIRLAEESDLAVRQDLGILIKVIRGQYPHDRAQPAIHAALSKRQPDYFSRHSWFDRSANSCRTLPGRYRSAKSIRRS